MLEVVLQKRDNTKYDISCVVTNVNVTDVINKSGVLTCGIIKSDINVENGDMLRVTYDKVVYFLGYVFKISQDTSDEIKITAYDQLRYLKCSDSYIFKNDTVGEILKQICNDFKLKTGEIQNSNYRLGKQIFVDKSLLDIIAECLKINLTNTKEMFFVKDNAGVIELKNINTTIVKDIGVGDKSLLYGYAYDKSIDDDTYNKIKIVRDNEDTGERSVYIEQDSKNINNWGILQYYEKVDDTMNAEQIKAKLKAMLKLKNREQKTLSIDLLGHSSIRAGNVIFVSIDEIGIKKFLLCVSANHVFGSSSHTVKAEVRVV